MNVVENLSKAGYVFLSTAELRPALDLDVAKLEPLQKSWDSLPRDQYLRDGGHYRSRRHSCFIEEFAPAAGSVAVAAGARGGAGAGVLTLTPHRAHWQPTSYNALHGGIERWFEPIESRVVEAPVWQQLLTTIGSLFAKLRPVERWFIEAHQFRIDTAGGIGRPTPEGAHRDGVDFVALMLVRRRNVRGGETRVFDAHGPTGVRFTMDEPWSLLLMDDERVIHETTPIQPDGDDGVRDTLVLTYRAKGFQAPA
jgi:hypothetical protein